MKKSIKRIAVMIFATNMILSSAFTSLAAWEQSEAGWKYKDDATQQYVTATWIESTSEKGLWYYINGDGVMATNTLIDDLYYVNDLGEWREPDNNNYGKPIINEDGVTIGYDLGDVAGGYTVPEKEIYVPGDGGSGSDPFPAGNIDPSMVNGQKDPSNWITQPDINTSEEDIANFLKNR